MNIVFKEMKIKDIPQWEKWIVLPHIKNIWRIDGKISDYINQKINGNGYDYSFIIYLENQAIGYIQCCDLYAYRSLCKNPKGFFIQENPGTFSMDLFIGEINYLNKGYGTEIIKQFTRKLFDEFDAKKILVDPETINKRAIRCYEKAGFTIIKKANDGVTECAIMEFMNKNK